MHLLIVPRDGSLEPRWPVTRCFHGVAPSALPWDKAGKLGKTLSEKCLTFSGITKKHSLMGQNHSTVTVSGTVWQLVFYWLLSETVVLVLVQFVLLFLPSPAMRCDHWIPDLWGTPFERGVGSCDPSHDLDLAHCGPLGYSC